MGRTIVMIHYRTQEGQHQVAERELSTLISRVRETEPGCGGITMVRDAEDPASICLIEDWPSREAYLGPHMETPHLQAFIQRAASFLAGPPDISFWDALAEV